MEPTSATPSSATASQFRPASGGPGGPKFVVTGLVLVILALFLSMAAIAVAFVH